VGREGDQEEETDSRANVLLLLGTVHAAPAERLSPGVLHQATMPESQPSAQSAEMAAQQPRLLHPAGKRCQTARQTPAAPTQATSSFPVHAQPVRQDRDRMGDAGASKEAFSDAD
jgi:hypothetical protein